jgi:hypothetical protein
VQPEPPRRHWLLQNPVTRGIGFGVSGCAGCLTFLVLLIIVVVLLGR